jgi:thioredoxin-like negative regulator of GroEL
MMFKPIFEAASKKHTDVTFASLDTEAEPALFGSLGFQAIPTIMAFKDGKRLFAEAGALPAAEFERLIDHLKKIEVVRRPKTA